MCLEGVESFPGARIHLRIPQVFSIWVNVLIVSLNKSKYILTATSRAVWIFISPMYSLSPFIHLFHKGLRLDSLVKTSPTTPMHHQIPHPQIPPSYHPAKAPPAHPLPSATHHAHTA